MRDATLRYDGIESRMFLPSDDGRSPALVFLHERYGLVRHTLDLARKAAGEGFVGVAPDLFSRWTGDRDALTRGEVRALLPDPDVGAILHRTIDELRGHPRIDPARIVVIGVCQSGRYAAVVASERRDLAACVVLYGAAQERDLGINADQPRAMADLIRDVSVPFLLIYGEADHVISVDNVRRLRGAFEDARRSYRLRIFADMPHGWLNDTMPGRYRPAGAAEAWAALTGFVGEVFAGAWPAGRVRWEFASDVSADYDFTKNVRLE
jgi:carboxymethylenebutenolidase